MTVILRPLYKLLLYGHGSTFSVRGASFPLMTRRFLIAAVAAFRLGAAPNTPPRAELTQIKNVYLLPMGQGLDQYLANHLTRQGLYQVVADPAQADAVFTEQLGRDFEHRFKDLFLPEEPEKGKDSASEDKDKDAAKEDEKALSAAERAEAEFMRSSSFSRGRGNVFLVEVKTRRVIWSFHLRPKNSSPREVNDTAIRIVNRLASDLKGK